MRRNVNSRDPISYLPLVGGLAMGMVGIICVNDIHNSKQRTEIREGVMVLDGQNRVLDEETGKVLVGLSRNAGPLVVVETCKTAYENCILGMSLSKGCDSAKVQEVCSPEISASKPLDQLMCCLEITRAQNACKMAYKSCLTEEQTINL